MLSRLQSRLLSTASPLLSRPMSSRIPSMVLLCTILSLMMWFLNSSRPMSLTGRKQSKASGQPWMLQKLHMHLPQTAICWLYPELGKASSPDDSVSTLNEVISWIGQADHPEEVMRYMSHRCPTIDCFCVNLLSLTHGSPFFLGKPQRCQVCGNHHCICSLWIPSFFLHCSQKSPLYSSAGSLGDLGRITPPERRQQGLSDQEGTHQIEGSMEFWRT